MSLREILAEPSRPVRLYGATPPKSGSDPEHVQKAIRLLSKRLKDSPADGVIVYDVQDETARNDDERPFAYTPGIDSLDFSALVSQALSRETLCYKCVVRHQPDAFQAWLDKALASPSVAGISLVGGASSSVNYGGISLADATRLAHRPDGKPLGAVAIPERHATKGDEPQRMLEKKRNGIRFFITQAIYDVELCERFLKDYLRACSDAGEAPARIAFTFAPCGGEKTLRFMEWLGIRFPDTVQNEILGAANPIEESLRLCERNLARILETVSDSGIPIGINVESVSIHKEERDASIDLLNRLSRIIG